MNKNDYTNPSEHIFYCDKNYNWISKKNKIEEFWKLVAKEKVRKGDFDFSEFVFPMFSRYYFPRNQSSLIFDSNVIFTKAKFIGKSNFQGVTFKKKADFEKCHFEQEANFSNSFFENEAIFSQCEFFDDTSFEAVSFRGTVTFESSKFAKSARFNNLEFINEASFFGTSFSGNTTFFASRFSGISNFDYSQFKDHAEFSKSKFSNELSFLSARFSGYTYFLEVQVLGKVLLNQVSFLRDVKFTQSKFEASLEVKGTQFLGNLYFGESSFYGSVDFSYSGVSFNGIFKESQFNNEVVFFSASFSGDATFESSTFEENINFERTEISGSGSFSNSHFKGILNFRDSIFTNTVDFSKSQFDKEVDFSNSKFVSRAKFYRSIFRDELIFHDSNVSFLKDMKLENIDFEGSVLEETRLYGSRSVKNVSFRNAFLLSLSLAGKELESCDFTGAVIGAVQTRGWKPDKETLESTKYIYTDWKEKIHITKSGEIKKTYEVVEDSRVPAEGYFESKEHLGFNIASYLKEPFRWSLGLNLPHQIRSGFLSYIQFFTDFMRVTQGRSIEVRTKIEGKKVRVEFLAETEEEKYLTESEFQQYIKNIAFNEFEDIEIHFSNNISNLEKDLFKIKYESQINNLKTELRYTHKLLESYERDMDKSSENNNDLRQLLQLSIMANKEPTKVIIKNQLSSQSESSVQNDLKISLDLGLISTLIDEVKEGINSKKIESESLNDLVEALKSEKETIKKNKTDPDTKGRLKKFMNQAQSLVGRGGKYILDNQDKISKLIERIQEFL